MEFKVLLLVNKSLNGLGRECIPLKDINQAGLLVQTKHGKATVSNYAACNWNQPPKDLRCAPNEAMFKSRLKTSMIDL